MTPNDDPVRMMARSEAQEKMVYRITEVAGLLGIGRQHASRLIREGQIPGGLRLGTRTVVRKAVFDEWIGHQTVN
jgi:excisionase family DNA binding protein